MRTYQFTGPIFEKPKARKRHPRAVMFVVGCVESMNEDGVLELGVLGDDGYFRAKASFLPSVADKERQEFLHRVL
jgi:hypothetical protein